MTDLFSFAQRQRDLGIQRAADHADRVEPGPPAWTDQAFEWIKKYAATHHQFISEQCTQAAMDAGFESPTDPRSWGGPYHRAVRAGIIKRVGYGISKRRNLSPTPLWASQIFQGRS